MMKKILIAAALLSASMSNAFAGTGGGSVSQCYDSPGMWDGTYDSAAGAATHFCNVRGGGWIGANMRVSDRINGWYIETFNRTGSGYVLQRQDCLDILFTVLETCQHGNNMKRGGNFTNGNSGTIIHRDQ